MPCSRTKSAAAARTVTLTPLTLSTRLDRLPGIALFQIEQTTPTELLLRLQPTPGADPEQTWRAAHHELADLLATSELRHVGQRDGDAAIILPSPYGGSR